jgi:hypothetical protein
MIALHQACSSFVLATNFIGLYLEPLAVTRHMSHGVIASAAKQSIFRSNYLKEDGLLRYARNDGGWLS